jgi:glycosyltransferase involved in cell wall biosynthesis
MKVLVLVNGLTHYYNLVLNKLNSTSGIHVVVVAPAASSKNIGHGVHQTKSGIEFKLHELKEVHRWPLYTAFRGLSALLWRERPDVIIVPDIYMLGFLLSVPLLLTSRLLGIRFIMQSIPFRLPTYQDALRLCGEESQTLARFPAPLRRMLRVFGVEKWLRRLYLELRRLGYRLPAAHLNYVDEAYVIYGSYGVPRERIFITYNSPDTDEMREIEKTLPLHSALLPPCRRRIIHIGRLVEWKRVDLLIRAFTNVCRSFSDAELLIVGSGPVEQALKDQCEELGVSKSVRFVGGVYDPVLLAEYLRVSTVYVLAGMGGLSINDAMFHRLPVICSVCDGTEKKLVRDGYNGRFFREGDEVDLTTKLRELLADPARCREMGLRSRQIIDEEINIHTLIDGYVRAFKYVTGAAGEPCSIR